MLLFSSYSLRSIRFNYNILCRLFTDIKFNYFLIVKLIRILLVFLIINYNRYIYYSLGLRIIYGYILLLALFVVLYRWVMWMINGWQVILRHFLPIGILGLLKIFIPILEIIGIIIRPLTLGVRLATNISCGHVVLIIFRYFAFNLNFGLLVLISLLLFALYFIEFLVCLIQAYVFWRLLYIYFRDMEL